MEKEFKLIVLPAWLKRNAAESPEREKCQIEGLVLWWRQAQAAVTVLVAYSREGKWPQYGDLGYTVHRKAEMSGFVPGNAAECCQHLPWDNGFSPVQMGLVMQDNFS